MRVDLKSLQATPLRTSFWYGVYRAGKTHFCSTFPRVAWFGSAREGGAVTIAHMDPATFYEPNIPPQVFTVASAAEMMAHLNTDVMPQVRTGQIRTIVLELSFYSDDMIRSRADEMTWAKYADLEKHIMFLDEQWKKVPGLRICYNTLAATEDDKKKPGGVLMAGRALPRKMPAVCDAVGYLHTEDKEGGGLDRILHLQPFGNFPAGHRYGGRLPPFVKDPTFRKIEALLAGRATCNEGGEVMFTGAALAPLPAIK